MMLKHVLRKWVCMHLVHKFQFRMVLQTWWSTLSWTNLSVAQWLSTRALHDREMDCDKRNESAWILGFIEYGCICWWPRTMGSINGSEHISQHYYRWFHLVNRACWSWSFRQVLHPGQLYRLCPLCAWEGSPQRLLRRSLLLQPPSGTKC